MDYSWEEAEMTLDVVCFPVFEDAIKKVVFSAHNFLMDEFDVDGCILVREKDRRGMTLSVLLMVGYFCRPCAGVYPERINYITTY